MRSFGNLGETTVRGSVLSKNTLALTHSSQESYIPLTITFLGLKHLVHQVTAQNQSLLLAQTLSLLMPQFTCLQVIPPAMYLQAQHFCVFLPVTVKYIACNQLLKNVC